MKKRNLKLAGLALSCAVAFSVGGVIATQTASAGNYVPTGADFQMLKGASVRTEENPGIRFTAYLSEDYVESLGADFEMGMAIIPKSVADGISGFDVKEMDNYIAEDQVQVKPVKEFVPEELEGEYARDGYKMFRMSLVQIPETLEFWETDIIANAYVKVGNKYTFVTDFTDENMSDDYENTAQSRDIAHVAAEASASGETGKIIDDILEAVSVGKTLALNATLTNKGNVVLGIGAGKETTVSGVLMDGDNATDYAVAIKSSNENVATVDKNGKITGVENGKATISANFGSLTPVTQTAYVYKDVYDFEKGRQDNLLYETDKVGGKDGEVDNPGDIGWTNKSMSGFPEWYGEGAVFMLAGSGTSSLYLGISMDYLEYAFSNSNVTSVMFDYYITGISGSNAFRENQLTGSWVNFPAGRNTEETLSLSITRENFDVLKDKKAHEMKIQWYRGNDVNTRFYIDNLRMVTA